MKAPLLDAPVVDMEMRPKAETLGPGEIVPAPLSVLALVERVVSNPNIDPVKLEKFIELQERIMKFQARAEFDAAFAVMQGELPIVVERGKIKVNGELRSRYATYEDVIDAVRPVLTKHGFAIRHRNIEGEGGKQTIVGILSHRSGHSEEDYFTAPPDTSGSKNNIQAIGSTRAYGQRYTTNALLGIATRGDDNDGAGAQPEREVKAPEGFEAWWDVVQGVADSGWAELEKAWAQSRADFKTHLANTDRGAWNGLKVRANTADKARAAAKPQQVRR